MAVEILVPFGIVAICIALLLIKKISSAIKCTLALLVLVLGGVGYVIFVPSSSLSIWITENIAATVKLDTTDKYEDGETIFTYEFDLSENTDNSVDGIEGSLQNAMNSFLASRIEAIASKYIDLQEEYVLSFSDSYLLMTPGELSMSITIFKGVLPEVI